MGCGVACIAMVAGISYADARTLVQRRRARRTVDTTYLDVVWVLERLGFVCAATKRSFPGWSRLRGRAVVAIDRAPTRTGKKPTGWHWVVFDDTGGRRLVLDPEAGPSGERVDFRSMKGRGFISVSRPEEEQ